MNDDREVTCFALANDALAGKDVREAGVAAWLAQKDADDGCAYLAATLAGAEAAEPGRHLEEGARQHRGQPAARRAPGRRARLRQRRQRRWRDRRQPGPLSRARRPAPRPAPTPSSRRSPWRASRRATATRRRRSSAIAGNAPCRPSWRRTPGRASPGRARSSCSRKPPTSSCAPRRVVGKSGREIELSDETLAWKVRAALRADNGRARWQQVIQAINAMSPSEQKEAAWVYWKARGAAGRRARLAGRRGAARDQPRAAGKHRRPAQLLRRARRRRSRPDADPARAAGAADAPPSAKRPPPIPASRAGCC